MDVSLQNPTLVATKKANDLRRCFGRRVRWWCRPTQRTPKHLRLGPKSSRRVRRHHNGQTSNNSVWNLRPEPHGQRSLRPSFSISSTSPCTTRSPRLTRVSDGNDLRRLLEHSKARQVVEIGFFPGHDTHSFLFRGGGICPAIRPKSTQYWSADRVGCREPVSAHVPANNL